MSFDFFTIRKDKDGFPSKESSYTVGLDKHGYTILNIHSADGYDTTLFMNQHSTKHLIRLLQATLNEENTDE